jgi:hypothetical protein
MKVRLGFNRAPNKKDSPIGLGPRSIRYQCIAAASGAAVLYLSAERRPVSIE